MRKYVNDPSGHREDDFPAPRQAISSGWSEEFL
jgi:hypothetical protein